MTLQQTVFTVPPTCRCGRRIAPQHCPCCGGSFIYAVRKNNMVDAQGTVYGRGFRCRRCGIDFHSAMPCEAPLSREAAREARQHAEQQADSNREQVVEMLHSQDPAMQQAVWDQLRANMFNKQGGNK